MLDFIILVLAEARQALRVERGLDFARPLLAVGVSDGAVEVAVAHQFDADIGGVAALGHSDVEMLNVRADVGYDLGQLRLAVAVGEHPHRHIVFPDAVDPSGEMIFGAKGGFEKSVRDLGVGETLLFRALARGDSGNFGRGR
jgi:hypothetical protein